MIHYIYVNTLMSEFTLRKNTIHNVNIRKWFKADFLSSVPVSLDQVAGYLAFSKEGITGSYLDIILDNIFPINNFFDDRNLTYFGTIL